jgi:hypothetical protein
MNHSGQCRYVTLTWEVIVFESYLLHLHVHSQHEGVPHMGLQTTVTQLKFASAVVIGFGLLTALAAFPPLNPPTLWLIDLMFLPFDGQQNLHAPETRILSAILGGILVGFGVLQWLVVTKLFTREPALARQMLLTSMGAWFVVDCTASAIAGAPFNAVMNVPFLLLFVVPLWRGNAQVQTR